MKAFIKLEDVTHVYSNGVAAVQNVNLEIKEGEIVAILGSNGSGKTTLVKHFNGLLKPTSGRVLVNGMDTRKEKIAKISSLVGYVFQNPNHQIFLPTVREELYYGCKNLKMPREEVEKRVRKAIEIFELDGLLDTNPFDLNYSKRKEIAMASIMAISPDVIVLDEPTTGQDHRGCKRVLDLVRLLHSHGHIVVLITHDMQLVGELNCRVVVMNRGKVIADNQADMVFTNHELMEIAGLQPPQVTELASNLPYLNKEKTYLTIDSIIQWFKNKKKNSRVEGVNIATGTRS
ncbi:ABC transporter ATP-binding protein [Geobacillus thermodenitrificans]|uniref:energy-coupling factor ABC transporter ATP-binding protein n=1 Tax=Geobacillus thermodenitrificans TaxID=33940 RepID=UPI002E203E63|nr:ABC transporter ATP-binding protein [Geobacillus thermodenitrificans]